MDDRRTLPSINDEERVVQLACDPLGSVLYHFKVEVVF